MLAESWNDSEVLVVESDNESESEIQTAENEPELEPPTARRSTRTRYVINRPSRNNFTEDLCTVHRSVIVLFCCRFLIAFTRCILISFF